MKPQTQTTNSKSRGTAAGTHTLDLMVSMKEVTKAAGVSARTIYRWLSEKRFPAPVLQSGSVTRWRQSDITRWQQDPANWSPGG